MNRKAAFYIRLSDADEEVKKGIKDESNSIGAQRELLYSFIRRNEEFAGYEVTEYFDDGISGTGFENRESFQRMIKDAKEGQFECILVKDFSRFGRDYLEVGNYLEFVFPLMGIRFISVNDGYDSSNSVGMTGGMDLAFKNLIYQLYSRDLSKKVKSARRNRNLNGEYTGAFVAYGYRKDERDHHKLVIDEEEADVVREIFTLSISGMSGGEIARELNARSIPTRLKRQWRKSRYVPVHDHGDYLWDNTMVNSILRNESYTGILIQNKCEMQGFGDGKRLEKRRKEDWSVVEGGIPAIVSREIFDRAQASGKPGRSISKKKKGINLFECPYCGRKLRMTRYAGRLVCNVRNMDAERPCAKIMMPLEKAQKLVLECVREICSLVLEQDALRITCGQNDQKTAVERIRKLQEEKERIERSVIELYKEYKEERCTKEEYAIIRKDRRAKADALADKISAMQSVIQKEEKAVSKDRIELCSRLEAYDADILAKVVSKVLVYDDKNIEIVLKGDDFYDKTVRKAAES